MFAQETKCSRRIFLAGAASGIAATALDAALLPAADSAPKKPGKPRFGFTTYQWGRDWDIPTLIANCTKAKVFGVELRTSAKYAHGVELDISAAQRAEVKKRFADSPVKLVGIACGEKFDSPKPEEVKKAIEAAKGFLKLSADVGSSGVRVFPNDFHKDIPRETTIKQIAEALNEVGKYAADLGQMVRLECHGSAGDLESIRAIMDRVTVPSVRVKLNSSPRDAAGKGFEHNFNLVKPFLGDTLHVHDLDDKSFPHQLQVTLLVKMGWSGWALLEQSNPVEDRVAAIIEQRELWEAMVAKAMES
ncbi:MAG: sugar phosphate isomerase/epimerase [Candidatus Sumerlaeia bacterium]|nr:sugar phosphate isomerase/epimerase [Candidatus Sumerlaeia bacterium]